MEHLYVYIIGELQMLQEGLYYMYVSFRHAYETIIKLKNKDGSKVGILFSSHFERVKQLVKFFEKHSGYSTYRLSLSEMAKMMSPDGVNLPFGAKAKIVRHINKRQKTEYLIIEDKGDLPKSFLLLDELCNIIREIGEKIPVVVVSENAGEFSLVYGYDVSMIDIPSLNARSLKIKVSSLGTEELYFRNQNHAITSKVYLSNEEFFKNLLRNKIEGDSLFAEEKYEKAFEKYNAAISFHSKYDEAECPINDFVGFSLYLRCVACFLYGKWNERSDALELMKESMQDILKKLKRSSMLDLHGQMLKEYDLTFLGLRDGWLERINFLLFINEYIF